MIDIKRTEVIDILDKMQFFQGQRAGRELWNDKPVEVQEMDLDSFNRGIRTIRDYILQLEEKATQPKVGEWIPCSERLPKYTDEYNVTVGVASEFGYYERVTTLRFENIQGEKPKWIIPADKVYRVIAWQPLPAPYNAERGGKDEENI